MKFANFIVVVLFASALDPVLSIGQFYTSDKSNVYYIEEKRQYDWFQSLTTCARMNMTMLTIDSKFKSDEVNRLVLSTFGKNVILWVGGYVVGPSRKLTWIASGDEFTYTFWHAPNPDFYGRAEFCIQMGWGANMAWNDHQCNQLFGFICEYYRPQPSVECRTDGTGENSGKYHNIALHFNNKH